MARYKLGYAGEWQESFGEPGAAIERAREVAADGIVVEVVRRRFGLHSFVTAFPETERDALRARWRLIPRGGSGGGADGGSGGGGRSGGSAHHHYNSIGGHGGCHGGGHGGGH